MAEAFLGSGPRLGTSADTFWPVLIVFDDCDDRHSKKYITGAPGVAPVAGKPGLAMGIMGAPGAPGFRQTE